LLERVVNQFVRLGIRLCENFRVFDEIERVGDKSFAAIVDRCPTGLTTYESLDRRTGTCASCNKAVRFFSVPNVVGANRSVGEDVSNGF